MGRALPRARAQAGGHPLRISPTPLEDAHIVELEPLGDERGWFARTFDAELFRAQGMDPAVVQCNVSFNARAGTLRGMHYQAAPHGEGKLVRCQRGAMFDVIVDLRPESATYTRWFGLELTSENRRSLFVPAGFAHGFQTLSDDCEIHYQMTAPYVAEAARGVRWDDPAFGISWPDAPPGGRTIAERDATYPDFAP
jgi:dTDP-4-dehydrorhamnose 3,5-epimerase